MAKIPMTILRPQFFRGASVTTGDRIETESRKVAAVLTKLGRAREIPDLDRSEPFNLPDKAIDNAIGHMSDADGVSGRDGIENVGQVWCDGKLISDPLADPETRARVRAYDNAIAIGMDLASKDDQVTIATVPAKRAYKKRAYKRRGPAKRK